MPLCFSPERQQVGGDVDLYIEALYPTAYTPPMRLTREQIQIVLQTITQLAGSSARAYIFGSRLDDRARGGDVDLLVETPTPMPLIQRARLKHVLESQLNLPIDLVVYSLSAGLTPFQQIARARAIPLETGP